jgi:4-amino-4-deoxy-L-arabinose transferase-like glycosyltransferase
VFLVVLLGYTYVLGRYLAGPLVGMLGAVFLSLDPNVLGHAGLVTTDVPAAAGFVWASYYAVRFVARPNWRRCVAAGVGLGLAMACKFTCGMLAPGVVLLIVARAGWKRRWSAVPRVRYLVAVPVIAFVTLWATYLFNVGRLEDQHLFEEQKSWKRIPQWVKGMTVPMPSMPLGVMFMGAIGKQGFPSYLNGEITAGGRWYYFPEAIVLKTPVGFLGAFVVGVGVFVMSKRRRPWVVLVLVLCPSVLLLSAMVGKLQIGIRHVLPVLPFLYLFVGVELGRGWKVAGLLGLMIVAAVEGVVAHPDYVAFFNVLARGDGSRYLADSNLDWGQDVSRLGEYLKKSGRRDYVIKVSGVRVAGLVEFLGLDPKSREVEAEELRKNPRGLLALGVNARLGLEDARINPDGSLKRGTDWSWVEGYPVAARVGRSIVVYDLDRRPSP